MKEHYIYHCDGHGNTFCLGPNIDGDLANQQCADTQEFRYVDLRVGMFRATPLVRVVVNFTVNFAVCCCRRLTLTNGGFDCVLTFTRTSGAALTH